MDAPSTTTTDEATGQTAVTDTGSLQALATHALDRIAPDFQYFADAPTQGLLCSVILRAHWKPASRQ